MNESISKEEYEKIITSAPSDMELPVYVGKHNDELLYLDLVKAKSIAMYGTTGISSVCNTSLFSMLKAREQILRQKYFLCVSCVGGYYSWSFNDIPFAHEYITDPCVAVYDLLHYYNSVKNTLIELSGMTEDERKYFGYIYSFEEYKEYLAKHPRMYIFEGYCGPLSEGVLNDSGLDFATVKEAFENAYKFHIYIIIPDCIRGKNELAESIHTSINIERTEKCYSATIIQNGKTLKENICMNRFEKSTEIKMKNIFDFATRELSQDAFLRWLLENYNDPKLQDAAGDLLKEFCGIDVGDIKSMDTTAQWCNIDISAWITLKDGSKAALFIEDKTYSEEHNQLDKLRQSYQMV